MGVGSSGAHGTIRARPAPRIGSQSRSSVIHSMVTAAVCSAVQCSAVQCSAVQCSAVSKQPACYADGSAGDELDTHTAQRGPQLCVGQQRVVARA